jgi:hypothetical protein
MVSGLTGSRLCQACLVAALVCLVVILSKACSEYLTVRHSVSASLESGDYEWMEAVIGGLDGVEHAADDDVSNVRKLTVASIQSDLCARGMRLL